MQESPDKARPNRFGALGRFDDRRLVVALLGLAVSVQVAQGIASQPHLQTYDRSYWVVTYQEGFTRRGLAGELIRLSTGSVARLPAIEILQWLLTLSLVGAVGLVVLAALRRETPRLDLAAIALCCSPFVFDFVVGDRRPDQLGFLAVVGYGLALLKYPKRSLLTAALVGIALGIAVAVQDSAFLQCLPWAIILTMLAALSASCGPANIVARVAALCALPTMVAAASVLYGDLDARHVNRLFNDARRFRWAFGSTVFAFLPDDLNTSVDRVAHLSLSTMVGSVAVCVFLITLQGALMLGFELPRRRPIREMRATNSVLGLAFAIALVPFVALLSLGIDWVRWFASFGLMASVTVTLGSLYRSPPAETKPRRVHPVVVILVATYLLWLAPLPTHFEVVRGVRYLLMVPRV